jgi:hypothetical protein
MDSVLPAAALDEGAEAAEAAANWLYAPFAAFSAAMKSSVPS